MVGLFRTVEYYIYDSYDEKGYDDLTELEFKTGFELEKYISFKYARLRYLERKRRCCKANLERVGYRMHTHLTIVKKNILFKTYEIEQWDKY